MNGQLAKNDPRRIRKTDVILRLRSTGKKQQLGLLSYDLFTGKNNLHIIMDPQTCLWKLAYDNGVLPQPLKQQFTSYDKAFNAVSDYLKVRQAEIIEIID